MNDLEMAFDTFLHQVLPPDVSFAGLILVLTFVCCLFFFTLLSFLLSGLSLRKQKNALEIRLQESVQESKSLQAHVNQQDVRATKLITLLNNERKHAAEKLRLLEEAREELRLQFTHLSQQIFDEKSARFSELNREKLDAILQPFNNQLTSLKKEINEIYRNDSRERLSLKHEILQLRDLNKKVNEEAVNLTRALKGDKKVQGNWGELVLERVLERSGLRRGHEFDTQGGFRDADNRLLKPDVILHLPEGKDVIIDSKVSLVSWEHYVNSDREDDRDLHKKELVQAVRDHISTLGGKNYPGLNGIHSLDFVLMFMPIEAAFHVAFESDDSLLLEALDKNIVVVTPTTLLATLRTIENIWQFEQQSKNSLEIARRAGIMYDKFRSFVEEIEKVGRQLATCHNSYDTALLKLTRGRGNLIAQAEQLKELGVQVKKDMPKSITEISEFDLKN